MSEIKDFKDLKVWQKGIIIVEKCYYLTKKGNREQGTDNREINKTLTTKISGIALSCTLFPVSCSLFPARSALGMEEKALLNILDF